MIRITKLKTKFIDNKNRNPPPSVAGDKTEARSHHVPRPAAGLATGAREAPEKMPGISPDTGRSIVYRKQK